MRLAVATAFVCFLPAAAMAQVDEAAGLFTEAKQLPLVAQSVHVAIAGGEAELDIVQVFANAGAEIAQADYHLYLPEGATVAGFGFWQDGRFLAAELKEKEEARAAHHAAAADGRATALMKKEANIHTFSVYPVRAGELKQIETRVRVPVVMEMGKSRVRLPIDSFIGQAPVDSTVTVEITTDEPLAGVGVDGARHTVVGRTDRWAQLALTTHEPVELWYFEEIPPLLTRAEAIELEDGKLGIQVRVVLYDAGAWRVPYERLHLLVDSSFSMRRRAGALRDLIERVRDQAAAPVQVHSIGSDGSHRLPSDLDPGAMVQQLVGAGFSATADSFARAAERLGCGVAGVRCAAVTDPQLDRLGQLDELGMPIVLLSDPHERAYFMDAVPKEASLFQLDADSAGRLAAIGDELVLPVLGVGALVQDDRRIDIVGDPVMRVAEGGMLRLFALTDTLAPITLTGEVAGEALERRIVPELVDSTTRSGIAVRRGIYRELLASWMSDYRRDPNPALEDQIVTVSLREDIPTALTALQVDDPKLSLFAIKPGDPLLTVYHQPGLEEVIAWYPFGETRRLVFDEETRTFTDRFLVPRGWKDRLYRVEVFKVYAEGWVERAHAWYQIDEEGPSAQIYYDPAERILRIDTGDETHDVASVTIHGEGEEVLTLTPLDDQWMILADELPERFAVFVRDRAGNLSELECELHDGILSVSAAAHEVEDAPSLPVAELPVSADGHGLAVRGRDVVLTLSGRVIRFPSAGLGLRSLEISAARDVGASKILFATAGGDLVQVTCEASGARCAAQRLASFDGHPITGIEPVSRATYLVGVLGQGLFELRGERLRRSAIKVGSRFITGVVEHGADVFVGTAYNGLWRVRRRRAVKTRFGHPHVASLESTPNGLVVRSGFGRYLRRGRDAFEFAGLDTGVLETGSPDLTAAVVYEDQTIVAGFDGGLFRLVGDDLLPIELGLDAMQSRINAMLVWQDALWLGTEAGLLRVGRDVCGVNVDHVLDGAVHDLAASPRGLAVASSVGLFTVDVEGEARRHDFQSAGNGRFSSVAWWHGRLYAGGMEGLYWFDDGEAGQISDADGFDANWVTALLPDGDRLLVGTYDRGVFGFASGRAARIPALGRQWVPPHGMRRIHDAVWIGGTGMSPVRLSDFGDAVAVPAPMRDVNDFLPVPGGVLMVTSDGVARLSSERSLAAAE